MGASISRYLPTNQYDAAINAASPSAANPFATMADVNAFDTLAEILANGNTTGGTAISMTSGDSIIFTNATLTDNWESQGFFGIDTTTFVAGSNTSNYILFNAGQFTIRNTTLASMALHNGTLKGVFQTAALTVSDKTYTFKDESGTVAFISDVNALDLENVLSVDNQTGLYDIFFNDGRYAKFSDGGSFTVDFKGPATVSGSTKTITLPDTSGVVALSGESQPTSSTLATVLTNGATTGGTDITFTDADNMIFNATTGTQIGTATTQKLAFYGTTPVIQPTAMTSTLTSLTQAGTFTPDYAIQAMTNTSPYGFATLDEAETVLSVILNIQTRLDEAEDKLQSLGLFA